MNRSSFILLIAAVAFIVSSCGGKAVRNVTVHDRAASYKSVYIWEPDGHIDYSLLVSLKEGAAERLRKGGYAISTDPNATAAYFKITLYDAGAANGSDGYIRGRVFVIEATNRKVVYDVTAEVRGGIESGYPVDRFLDDAMGPLLGMAEE